MRFLIVIFVLFLTACQEKNAPSQTLNIISGSGVTHSLNVDVVTTPQDLARGLMFVENMPEDSGMLFWFGEIEAERGFWMKNTLIPLDMLFIKRDGTIHHIHENAIPHDLTSIRSNGPVAAVLEINGGLSRQLGIKVGDKVKHPVFK